MDETDLTKTTNGISKVAAAAYETGVKLEISCQLSHGTDEGIENIAEDLKSLAHISTVVKNHLLKIQERRRSEPGTPESDDLKRALRLLDVEIAASSNTLEQLNTGEQSVGGKNEGSTLDNETAGVLKDYGALRHRISAHMVELHAVLDMLIVTPERNALGRTENIFDDTEGYAPSISDLSVQNDGAPLADSGRPSSIGTRRLYGSSIASGATSQSTLVGDPFRNSYAASSTAFSTRSSFRQTDNTALIRSGTVDIASRKKWLRSSLFPQSGPGQKNAVHEALIQGDARRAIQLITDRSYVSHQKPGELTDLHVAALFGESEVVASLLDAGAEVNVLCMPSRRNKILGRDTTPLTPLHCAVGALYPDIVQILLRVGGTLSCRGPSSPAYALFMKGFLELHLEENQERYVAMLDCLASTGLDINSRITAEGLTLLHTACAIPTILLPLKLCMVKQLLDRGADVLANSDKGTIPLAMAISAVRSEQVVDIMLGTKSREQLDHVDQDGNTLLHLAVRREKGEDMGGKTATLRRLFAANASIKARNKAGQTAFERAKKWYGQDWRLEIMPLYYEVALPRLMAK